MIEQERQKTIERLAQSEGQVVLAVQDTTSFNFSGRQNISGLGVLDDNRAAGFFAHTTLAVSETGVPVGLFAQAVWARPKQKKAKDEQHKQLPITAKESHKWLSGLSQSTKSAGEAQVITICDREADIYELFALAQTQAAGFIVRVVRDRRTDEEGLLSDAIARTPAQATYPLAVARRPQEEPRQAQITLRFTQVTLLPPYRPKQAQAMTLVPLTLTVVEAVEETPPPDVTPIHWRLLTNCEVNDVAAAQRILRFYTYRWLVERFHFILKSGCSFEESQLQSFSALTNYLALCSSVAWHLLWITYQARLTPEASCDLVLEQAEWQALTAYVKRSPKPPPRPPTLGQAVRWIAELGGFIGRKSDGNPGVKVLWRGLIRLRDITDAWLLFHPTP
jgi:Transposase Tn5 dimerisation domain